METSALDRVATSIPVTMRTKNELKHAKGGLSYEDFIRHLLRIAARQKESTPTLQATTFERAEGYVADAPFGLTFHYNRLLDAENFRFDITLKSVRKDGKKIPLQAYAKQRDPSKDYFLILEQVIRKEIDPMFVFRKYGKEDFRDYQAWKKHFSRLGLHETSFEEDVMEHLETPPR
ncbi:hypothetical protein AUJ68_06475 [Candidatus Woesearchaeota archaeon CG1_02_57_44]|nr:MAG: hypothetical protein AUJ68_06475 [Candidatus Woesearchaeota archaeon CG1_02_57_44]